PYQPKECSFDHIDSLMKKLQLVISIPILIFGLSLNLLAICIFCCFLKKWTESSIYMVNLAFADLLLLLSLPFKMYFSREGGQWSLCMLTKALYFVNMYGSIFIIASISMDRYIAINHPFKAKLLRSPKKAWVVCGFIWIIVWLSSIPIYDFHNTDKVSCFHNMSDKAWGIPTILSVEIFGFLIPLTVVAYCSIKIIQTLLRYKKEGEMLAEQMACVRIIAANLMVFIVSFTPVHLGIFLQFLVRQHVIVDCSVKQGISFFLQMTLCLANVNCCLDAICYYFAAKEFRKNWVQRPSFSLKLVLDD
uniref:G protein-coupled receptor 55 n=1 Tax=Sphenodon punctatus TaxID=8508 RepID=A0A8D0HI72_SPHPU